MTTQEPITSNSNVPNGFQKNPDKFLLCFPCIITIDYIVDVGGIYDLVDFGDNKEIVVTRVKFFQAYVIGYRVTIVLLDIKSGEMLKRSHRIEKDELACDWVLTDLFTNPNPDKESTSQDDVPNNGLQKFDGGFIIDLPCIFCENKTVFMKSMYDLWDFDGRGGIFIRKVKFFDAYKKGYSITIVLLDLNSGELIKRSHRLGNVAMPCTWALIQCNYFTQKSNPKQKLLNDSHD